MDQILRDTVSTIQIEFRSGSTLTDPDGNAATASIYNSAAVEVAGSPFTATRVSPGLYQITLTPANVTATMDIYDVTWNATFAGVPQKQRRRFEVLGGFIASISEIRDFDPALADTTKYSDAAIRAAREAAEEKIEQLCGVSFRPRGGRAFLDGSGRDTLVLPDVYVTRIVSGSVDQGAGAIALSSSEVAALKLYPYGALTRPDGVIWFSGLRNVSVFYEHGLAEAPEPVRKATMALARAYLVGTAVYDRATSVSTDEGTFRLTLAGRDGSLTGVPEVDAVVSQFGYSTPAVG